MHIQTWQDRIKHMKNHDAFDVDCAKNNEIKELREAVKALQQQNPAGFDLLANSLSKTSHLLSSQQTKMLISINLTSSDWKKLKKTEPW